MKILLLCWRDSTHPQGGGSEQYLERVGEYLAQQGNEVVYQTSAYTDAPARSRRKGIRYLRAGGKFTVYPRAWWRMLRGRLGFGPLADVDVVIDTQNGIPFFAKIFSGRPTILLTHHCHREQWPVAGPFIARLGWFLESRVAPRVYRHSQYITVSQPSAEELVQLGVQPEQIRIIRNGVDPLPSDIPHLNPLSATHLMTLSRLVPHKHIEQAIDLVATVPDCHLDIVGSGWWAENLKEYARRSGVEDRISFHGQCSEAIKHALLERADIHLMPSRKEGWGLAVIEAAQHATPTVGYVSSGGLQDSIIHGETGLLAHSPSQFRDYVLSLWQNPQRRSELGCQAQVFAQQFSWEATGQAIAKVVAEQAKRGEY
ncbi:glycosyltransferase [Corynebacterium sp. 3HC-13]|uniref:glycosyltransferase family 4 protein n=1 Tax=Corynebacterium poyangense TaxID=2684405 RepID=UPI001CCEC8AB|nr:glycosyltransferase family 4 protein [Corynebacterium poyangense]MBZ8176615.1 glycosyltransferase [Corynebacterium poyangense]